MELFDLKIFIDTPDDVRFERRMKRDINERNRTQEGVRNQWEVQVLPMHKKYVENTINSANIIVSKNDDFDDVAKKIFTQIKEL